MIRSISLAVIFLPSNEIDVALFIPDGFGLFTNEHGGELFLLEFLHLHAAQVELVLEFENLFFHVLFKLGSVFQSGKHLHVDHHAFHAGFGFKRAVGKISGAVTKEGPHQVFFRRRIDLYALGCDLTDDNITGSDHCTHADDTCLIQVSQRSRRTFGMS